MPTIASCAPDRRPRPAAAARPSTALDPRETAHRQQRLDDLCAAEHPHCILCGPANALGLNLHFRVQADGSVAALFPCREAFQSYPQTLHGGVISALFDAAMVNALFSVGVVGVTAELSVRFLLPVVLNRGAVVSAFVEKDCHPLYHLHADLQQERRIMARATARFLVKDDDLNGR